MHKGRVTALLLTVMTAGIALASPMTVSAEGESRKYTPIVDWLHVTEEKILYDDMTDPKGPLVGAGSVPGSILEKIDTELHEDEVPEDQTYMAYYITRDGSKTIVTDDPSKRRN